MSSNRGPIFKSDLQFHSSSRMVLGSRTYSPFYCRRCAKILLAVCIALNSNLNAIHRSYDAIVFARRENRYPTADYQSGPSSPTVNLFIKFSDPIEIAAY